METLLSTFDFFFFLLSIYLLFDRQHVKNMCVFAIKNRNFRKSDCTDGCNAHEPLSNSCYQLKRYCYEMNHLHLLQRCNVSALLTYNSFKQHTFFRVCCIRCEKMKQKILLFNDWSSSKCRKNWKNGTVRFQLTKWSNTWAKRPASAFRVERPFTWADRKLKIDIVHNIILCVSVCIHYYWVIHSVSVLRVLYDIWISHIQFTNPY